MVESDASLDMSVKGLDMSVRGGSEGGHSSRCVPRLMLTKPVGVMHVPDVWRAHDPVTISNVWMSCICTPRTWFVIICNRKPVSTNLFHTRNPKPLTTVIRTPSTLNPSPLNPYPSLCRQMTGHGEVGAGCGSRRGPKP